MKQWGMVWCLLFFFGSCQNHDDDDLQEHFKEFRKMSDAQYGPVNRELANLRDDLIDYQDHFPVYRISAPARRLGIDSGASTYYRESEEVRNDSKEKLRANLLRAKELIERGHKLILQFGKLSYDMSKKGSSENYAYAQVGVVYTLINLRFFIFSILEKMLESMNAFDQKTSQDFKKEVMAHYLSYIGLVEVIDRDGEKTIKNLSRMWEQSLLSEELVEHIDILLAAAGRNQKGGEVEKLRQQMTKDQLDQWNELSRTFQSSFKYFSLLYDPNNPDHPLVHISVVLSNLSWGLVNTLVGAGFITTAAVMSPLTWIIRKTILAFGFQPLIFQVRFPELRVAKNKMQIYADVCGLQLISSKMSMGLFELDFCTSHSYASDHEGGHAKQSAILGPLYIPVALLSYALIGGHGGGLEHWADHWRVH